MERARPSSELLESIYRSKRQLHEEQRALPLPDKIRHLIALQQIDYEIRRARGEELKSWERPWDIEP